MEHILITGCSGYIAGNLIRQLEQRPDVKTIVGLDLKKPDCQSNKFYFYRHDVREPFTELLSRFRVDTVVHTAFILPPLHNKSLMEDININGTKNVLNCCLSAKVQQLLYTSSTTAYGFHADNPIPMQESQPLRGNDNFVYSKSKKDIERYFAGHPVAGAGLKITILRPCFVIGPTINNPVSRYFNKPIVVIPKTNAPFQFVHEDDLTRAMVTCLESGIFGIYNIAGEGTITVLEMAEQLGNRLVYLSDKVAGWLNSLAWKLRLSFLTEIPSEGLDMIRYPWISSSQKFIETADFKYNYTTPQAFADFARHQKKNKPKLHKFES